MKTDSQIARQVRRQLYDVGNRGGTVTTTDRNGCVHHRRVPPRPQADYSSAVALGFICATEDGLRLTDAGRIVYLMLTTQGKQR